MKTSARRVFISYARKDGTEAAHQLRDVLRGAECEVWLDTERIRGGASWGKDIEEALNGCDVLVAVLTPASFLSEICRAEQIWALDEGKLVIPVLAVAGAPVPIHLKSRNWRKFPEQQAEFRADIAAERAITASIDRPLRYDTVPNLPQNHVMRAEPLARLRDLVFTEGAGANIAVTAVAGMGGIGKTVLATALCRDVVVQRAFPDGIAWITIGREWDGDFVTRMREVARALGDDLAGYDNPLACANRYRTILREKAALVVVDDVWNLEHLKPLLVDAPRSRFLFTTRDAGLAKAVTDRKYSANLLSGNDARELLARWAGVAVEKLPPEAEQIIHECGELAAAVVQVGASLRDLSPEEWGDTLEALQSADVSAIEDRLPTGQKSFFKSLAVSFEATTEQMQPRYLKLAVLLEDVPAPLVVLLTLWKVNEAEGRRTARYFVDRSLASWEDAADTARGIRLHDLQLDYVRARFENRAALQLIHDALRLSANVIARRPEEFASQMVGRLLTHEGNAAVAEFTKDVATGAPKPWLRPLWPSLHPPGTGLIRTLAGHTWFVQAVAVTPDGQRAVSASWDNTLKIWDLTTGLELRTLRGHSAPITGLVLTPDGQRAVSASYDKTLKVWDLTSGKELRTLASHSAPVTGVAVTAGGQHAISVSYDKTVKMWDLASGQELRTLAGHSAPVAGVAVTGDPGRAVSASHDHTLKVWDMANGRELSTLAGHLNSVVAIAVTPDGQRAVSASWDNTLKVWDLATGKELRTLAGHSNAVVAVAVTPDGRRVVSGSHDKTLKMWDLDSGQVLRTLVGHSAFVYGVAITPDGRRAVSASHDKFLNIWDLGGGQELRTHVGHPAPLNGVAVTPDGERAVSASSDKTLKVWDLGSAKELVTLAGHLDSVVAVTVMAFGQGAVSASDDDTLMVWDLANGRQLLTLAGHSDSVAAVAMTAAGRCVVSASFDKTLKVWDLPTGRVLRTLVGHSESVRGVAVTPDGIHAVSASSDHTIKVWHLDTGQNMCTMAGHSAPVRGVAVTLDGARVISASSDMTLRIWQLETGQELRTLTGHSDSVLAVVVMADGRLAVSASSDNTLKAWDIDSGAVVASFTCDGGALCCAIAGPDEILAGDEAGRLHFLKLET